MTKQKTTLFAAIACAVVFTLLFHRQDLGLNVFLMETVLFIALIITKSVDFRTVNHRIFGLGLLLTSCAVVVVYSPYVIAINIISLFIFVGTLIYPQAKSLVTLLLLAFCNIPAAQNSFFVAFSYLGKRDKKSKGKRLGIFVIPVVIILFFLLIYSGSSPYFSKFLGNIGTFLQDHFFPLFKNIDLLIIVTFAIGMIICNFVFFRNPVEEIIADDRNATDFLVRTKKKKLFYRKFKFTGLKDEYRASIFLLLTLNVMLLIVNALDIYWVWFNFTWNGLYLKQFVHEGTYLLLLSIVCSIIIVLYFFRGNLNFFSRNKFLRRLSLIWLAQNAVLTVSVAIRNLHYVHYFALAYKRIGLMLFLLLTLYGLYTVYVKVSKQKSAFYLFRTNFFTAYVILVLSSLVNWENIIAKYNFSHFRQSFVELQYLSDFPDKSLPELDKSSEEISEIKALQKTMFPFEKDDMPQEIYLQRIEARKISFIKDWESRNILSWNYPEYEAYQKLKQNDN